MVIKNIAGYFLMACLLVVLFLMFEIFKPFIAVIFLAAVVVTISYPAYLFFEKKLWNRSGLASLLMCALVSLVIIIPTVFFLGAFTNKSIETYKQVETAVRGGFLDRIRINDLWGWVDGYLAKTPLRGSVSSADLQAKLQDQIISIGGMINSYIISGTRSVVKGATGFILSIIFFLITMYYLFKDGDKILNKFMYLSPLANKYDRKLFEKFREMSISTMLSTFVVAFAQALVSGIGYVIVGVPAFFLAVATGFCGLVPVVGATVIWVPAGIILLLMGQIWQGLFLLVYGVLAISLVDNLVRPILIQGRTNVHPLLVFFSIIGGVAYLGPMGFLFGPLILSVFLTFIHIYEIEYRSLLEE